LGRYRDALVQLEIALRLDPDFAEAYYHKGVALEQFGQKTEAQQAYARAKQLGYT